MAARFVRDEEAAGSNPATPTRETAGHPTFDDLRFVFFLSQCPILGAKWERHLFVALDTEGPRGMTTVDIADIDAALGKVRTFISLLEQNHATSDKAGIYSDPSPQHTQTDNQIQEQFSLIRQIATRADANLVDNLKKDSSAYGWPYYRALDAARQLAGRLSSVEEEERILGPRGPKLVAANLHPWIWNAAVDLWDDGHRREAVQAVAQALFDNHMPAKLGVPSRGAKDLVAMASSTDEPTAGNPRLRLNDYPEKSQNWTSQHEGARFFGMGCAQLIRNLATHVGSQQNEQTALEQLASLSLFARLVDRANKVTL